MTSALVAAKSQGGQLAHEQAEERRMLWRNTIAKDCNDAEFAVFCEIANRLGLDPLAKQIVPVRYSGKIVHQVTIDGFRSLAERSGEYRGQTPVEWTGDGKTWVDVWTEKTSPIAARVGVHRKDFVEPIFAVALTNDFRANGPWWKKSGGAHQIGKCAEALAFRKAFPQTLGGLYTAEEMEQAKGSARIDSAPQDDTPEAVVESIDEAPAKKPKKAPEWVTASQAAFRKLAAGWSDPEIWAQELNEALRKHKLRQVETAKDADHWLRSTLPELGVDWAKVIYAEVRKRSLRPDGKIHGEPEEMEGDVQV